MFDKEEMRFQARVMSLAMSELSAKCEDDGSEEFLSRLYEKYKEEGQPANRDSWILENLKPHFRCVADPPRWVEDEPDWPFHRGEPMVFIGQIPLPKNEVTEEHLTWDEVIYLFGARTPHPQGFTVEYRTVVQIKDLARE